MEDHIVGKAYVVWDDIDTDAIIPAKYLNLSHTHPDQRVELARHAMEGLRSPPAPFVVDGKIPCPYQIIVAGDNFGCGSSRAQAPGALHVAGIKAVIASYYARIFYRNSVNAALLIPLESVERLCEKVKTGDELGISISRGEVVNRTRNERYRIKELGAIRPILEAGDVFEYAKQLKEIGTRSPQKGPGPALA